MCVYLSLKALTKISDVMESKPILKGTRLQSICRCVENHFAVQSICDRVLSPLQKLRVRLGTCKTGLSPPVTLCY